MNEKSPKLSYCLTKAHLYQLQFYYIGLQGPMPLVTMSG